MGGNINSLDHAVSELIGALLLIGIVVSGLGLISVLMLSQPPPDTYPQVTLSTYAVQCIDNTYEVFVYHDGGESLHANQFDVEVNDKEVIPELVFYDIAYSCGNEWPTSSEIWDQQKIFSTGYTLKISTGTERPVTVGVYYKEATRKLPIMINTIRQVNIAGTVTGHLRPILENVECNSTHCAPGECTAQFSYINNLNDTFKIPIHKGNTPWNEFTGSKGSGCQMDMGQFKTFVASTATHRFWTECFKGSIQWKLNDVKSAVAVCQCL